MVNDNGSKTHRIVHCILCAITCQNIIEGEEEKNIYVYIVYISGCVLSLSLSCHRRSACAPEKRVAAHRRNYDVIFNDDKTIIIANENSARSK